ncbi:right-handed parallel beta-helix repeat-containing protein [Verrucomicrobiota bacterium]
MERARINEMIGACFVSNLGRRRRTGLSVVLLVTWCCSVAHAVDYYVSPTGKDTDPGTLAKPWKSITTSVGKLNDGDVLHLAAGATFAENVYIGTGGTSVSPITLTSDPVNRATIQGVATSCGILIWDTGGVVIENVIVVGPGPTGATRAGIGIMSDNGIYQYIRVRNVDVSGYDEGVNVLGYGGTDYGFRDVVIEDSCFHHNLNAGGMTWAENIGGIRDITVRRCTFNDNYGDPAATGNSGSGFVFGGVITGRLEYCVAYSNGGHGVAGEGPVGLWAYDSSKITIQYCEAYANKAINMDGDGFDFDQNVTDSVMQYCYSHDNYGAGFLLCHGGSLTWSNNILRYCVSEDDGYGGKMGGIHYYSAASGLDNALVYGNTVFNSKAPALWVHQANNTTGAKVWNNIFVTTGGKDLVKGNVNTTAIQFQGNSYWSSGGAFKVAGYSSLDAWRTAKDQEMLAGNPVGFQLDPKLVAPGAGGIVGNATNLPLLAAYKLQGTSPLIDRGLNLSALFGIDAGARDFYGNTILQCRTYDVGAYESPDTDGDFVPDDWETIYFGGLDVSDGVSHQDADGVCDRDEFVAGTDPTNATSCFAVTDMTSRDGTNVVLTWPSTVGRCYAIRTDTNLVESGDTLLVSGIVATPPSNVYTCTVDNASARFYRAVIQESW